MNATTIPDGVGVRDFAIAAGISLGATYRAVYEGRLPARQILGRWLIPKQAARKFMTERRRRRKASQLQEGNHDKK